MSYEAVQTARFGRQYKKLHANVALDVDGAVEPKNGNWNLLRMSNALNLRDKMPKFPLTVQVSTPSRKFRHFIAHLQHLIHSRYGSNRRF